MRSLRLLKHEWFVCLTVTSILECAGQSCSVLVTKAKTRLKVNARRVWINGPAVIDVVSFEG